MVNFRLLLLRELVGTLLHKNGTVFLSDVLGDFRHLFSCHRKHFHKKRSGIDAVLSVYMAAYRESPGGFPSKQCVCLLHFRRNMLKSHGNLIAFFAEALRHLIKHMGGTDIPHDGSFPSLILQQVIIQQNQNIVGMQESSCIVNHANPVRISVSRKAYVAVIVDYICLQRTQSCICRRRELTSE